MTKRKKPIGRGGPREGAGRPRKYDTAATLCITLPASLAARVEAYALAAGMNKSEATQQLLARALTTKTLP